MDDRRKYSALPEAKIPTNNVLLGLNRKEQYFRYITTWKHVHRNIERELSLRTRIIHSYSLNLKKKNRSWS